VPEIIDENDFAGRPAATRDDRRGVARLEAFSDGVFAIAITLLVLGIEIPDVSNGGLNAALDDLVPDSIAYFIGFAVIGIFWINHHAFFGEVERHDSRLLWSNLLFLSLIAAMPFSTGLIGEFSGARDAVIIFAANVSLASLASIASERAAVRSRLLAPDSALYDRPFPRAEAFVIPAVFALSIPIAFLSPDLAQYSWLLSIPLSRYLEKR
jgi:uncharacterized membrane protein